MNTFRQNIKSIAGRADWPFLLFLVGITHTGIYFKLLAVIAYTAYLLYRKYSFSKSPGSIGWFYLLMPVLGLLSAAVQGSFQQAGYPLVAVWGVMSWGIAGIGFYLLRTRVMAGDREGVAATMQLFFIANLVVSLAQLLKVMIVSGAVMPYWYYDKAEVYGASTGDYIFGIFGGTSVINSAVSALGAFWFLYRQRIRLAVVCVVTMMLSTSNITIAAFLFVCLVMAVTINKRRHRLTILAFFVLSTVGYFILSPANLWYIEKTWNKFFGPEQVADNREIIFDSHFFLQPVSDSVYTHYKTDIAQLKQASVTDTSRHNLKLGRNAVAAMMAHWYRVPVAASPLTYWSRPGKLYAFQQTAVFCRTGRWPLVAGAGMGNFSSKLAVKATGLGIEGRFPESKIYISKPFMQAHLYTILYYFAQPAVAHSMMNMPDSVYDQLAGEYGIAGLVLFVVLYLGFFLRQRRKLRAAKYLLLIMLLFFAYEYWFEMISLTVIFELLSLADIFSNDTNEGNATSARHGIDAGL